MSRTKIVILQMKEIIYTGIFIGLGLLLVLLLLIMFHPGKEKETNTSPTFSTSEILYTPGVYTAQLELGKQTVNLEVVLDANHINGVQITTLDETVATMYPLLSPTVENISTQLSSGISLENVVLSSESQYTEMMILKAIDEILDKASIQ